MPKRNAAPWLFPHIIARRKPGMIGVLRNGQRSCNEGNGYPDHVTAMLAATLGGDSPESWLICTRAFQRRYGLGASRPSSLRVWPYLRSAYLRKGRMIEFLRLVPGFDAKAFDPFLATGAELGAKNIVTAPCDPDLGQSTANLGAFAEGASGFGLFPVLEFFPGPTLLTSSRSCRSG